MPVWTKIKDEGKIRTAKQTLSYMLKDKSAELLITHNLYGDDIDTWVAQYKQQYSLWETKQSKSSEVRHEAVSFSVHENKELLTRDLLIDVGEKMIELLGDDAMHTIVVHREKDHWHLHDCYSTSSIITQRALRLEGRRFIEIRKELEYYIRRTYPEIKHSFAYTVRRELTQKMEETTGDYRTKKA